MSTHTNISNGLFPMGQINGVAMPSVPPQTQPLLPPPQQLQQPQQQAIRPQIPMSNIDAHVNTSKFMPPQLSTGPVSVPATTTSTATRIEPLAAKNAQAPVNYLPAHLRPPATNGPSSLTNGGGSIGEDSTNSSRTSSPMVPISSAHHQQQQQPLNISRTQPSAMHGNNNAIIHGGVGQQQSVNSLSGSIQNLNLNRTNGSTGMQQPTYGMGNTNAIKPNEVKPLPNAPPLTTAVGQRSFSNINQAVNDAGNTYNQNIIPSPMSRSNILPPPPTGKPFGTTPVASSHIRPSTSQITPTSVPPLSNSSSATSSSLAPTYTVPNFQNQPQPFLHNANQPTTMSSGQPPSLPPNLNNAIQQNQFNNNNNQNPDVTSLQQRPPPQRRPMYPTNNSLTQPMQPNSMQQQQLQQQQPYMQAYQQQAPLPNQANTGMFNGQANSAPLQYQSQQPYVQQQPQYQQHQPYPSAQSQQQQQPQQMSVTHQGFSQLWGQDTIDLMQHRHILTKATLQPPKITLHNQFHESINCNPNIMRCTIAKIPESNSLLQKSRLPLGILIHPFRDINSLPVIQCPSIVRCRLCRTYINPFVYFVDSKMWKCNLCYRVNELPEDFQFDPATKTFGDVTRRPEVRSSTIEFIAPSEYMLRPPQPAIYLFLFDVSIIAQQSGYLENVCSTLSEYLDDMPGDARTQVGFIAYNSQVHFYSMAEGYNQPHEMTLIDIDDPFLPRPDNLLVNLKECKELVKDLLLQLPKRFADTHDPGSTLGAALQVAYKLMQASGGRVTVFQTCLPNKGPGSLEPREDPNNRSAKDVAHLNPATDFYKRYALDCSGYQIAVDLFLLNQQYSDLATISGISKHSGGCIHHFPLYQKTKPHHVDSFKQCFKRYLVRKIGFEAVMRIRCTRGLQVHTFHGNFFVRSTDLLSLPNVNPDAGYGMQISYDESLSDVKTICFQAALLYTNSEGERRIRVHTLCLPVTSSLPEVMHAADSEAIVGLLAKMAVDRSLTSNVADAREAFINATVDVLNAFKVAQNLPAGQTGQLIAPRSLALMPLYILALLKHPAFRVGTSTRLDDRVYAMDSMKTLPLDQLMKFLYPEFYQLDVLFYNAPSLNANTTDDDEDDDNDLPDVPRLQLSAEFLDSRSIFLLDCGMLIILYVGINVPVNILENVLGIKSTAELPDYYYGLPNVNSAENLVLRRFISHLNDEKPYSPLVQVIRDTSTAKPQFIEKLVDDRSESSLSYYEFLQHLRPQVK